MKFDCCLIAVKSMKASVKFYSELFGQTVKLDYGRNVALSGGFSLQEDYDWLAGVPKDSIVEKSHNFELYFETEDFDGFLQKLEAYGGIELVHPPKKHDWQQRVVRLYDPDHHIVEVGESMSSLARKFLAEGMTPEEISNLTTMPLWLIEQYGKEAPHAD